jgi:murein L,D-transpeptidase YafK
MLKNMWKKTSLTFVLIVLALVVYCILPDKRSPPSALRYDLLKVEKSKRLLHAFSGGKCIKTYRIALGQQPVGHKEFEGDGKTPEGTYQISLKNRNSRFHKSLGISYPNSKDKEHAQSLGKKPGGAIMIHGLPDRLAYVGKWHRLKDWTQGCIALTNEEMDEVFNAASVGIPIEILP